MYYEKFYIRSTEGAGNSLPAGFVKWGDHPTLIDMMFGVGSGRGGAEIGSIYWRIASCTSGNTINNVCSLANLIYDDDDTTEVNIIRNSDKTLYQIRTPSVFVEFSTQNANVFYIKYYAQDCVNESYTNNQIVSYAIKSGSVPFCTIKAEYVSSTLMRVVRYSNGGRAEVCEIGFDSRGLYQGRGFGLSDCVDTSIDTTTISSKVIESYAQNDTTITDAIKYYSNYDDNTPDYETTKTIVYNTTTKTKTTTTVIGTVGSSEALTSTEVLTPGATTTYTRTSTGPDGTITTATYDSNSCLTSLTQPWLDTNGGKVTSILLANATSVNGRWVTNSSSWTYYLPAEESVSVNGVKTGYNTYTYTINTSDKGYYRLSTKNSYDSSSTYVTSSSAVYESSQSVVDGYERLGLPYYVINADGSQTSYEYSRASLPAYTTGESPTYTVATGYTPQGWVSVAYSGTSTSGNDDGSTAVLFTKSYVQSLYLIPYVSTKTVTVSEDLRKLTEVWVYNGTDFAKVSWAYEEYTQFGNLIKSISSNGTTYSAVVNGDRVTSSTDATGSTTYYFYDAQGRIIKQSSPSLYSGYTISTCTYDGAGNKTSVKEYNTATYNADLTTEERLSAESTYDTTGYCTQTKATCGKITTYSRTITSSSLPLTIVKNAGLSDASSEAYYRDGNIFSITGAGVVSTYYSYSVNATTGYITTTVYGASDASSKKPYTSTTTDWLGRTVSQVVPNVSGSTITSTYNYYPSTASYKCDVGKLKSISTTGLVSMLYSYSRMGQADVTVYDLDQNNTISQLTDRVYVKKSAFVLVGDSWWTDQYTNTISTNSSLSYNICLERTRSRLTGFATNQTSESYQWGNGVYTASPNTAYATWTSQVVDTTAHTVTTSQRSPGVSGSNNVVNACSVSVSKYGNVISQTAPWGTVVANSYDGLGRPLIVSETGKSSKSYAYEVNSSKVLFITDSEGSVQSFDYADCGSGLVSRSTLTYGGVTKYTRYAYNARKQLTHTWGNATNPVKYEYDAWGRQTVMHTYTGGTGWDSNTSDTPPSGFADAGSVTTFTYDTATSLLLSKKDAANLGTTYTYDAYNRASTVTNARNDITTFTYNARGELTRKDYADTTMTDIVYTYDKLGRVATVTDATGLRTFTYRGYTMPVDALGLDNEALPSSFFGSFNTLYTDEDSYGRISGLSVTNPSSHYDILSQSYTRDATTLVKIIGSDFQDQGNCSTTTYNYATNTAKVSDAITIGGYRGSAVSGVTRAYTYTVNGRLSSETSTSTAGGSAIANVGYTYNAIGQRTAMTQTGTMFDYYGTNGLSSTFAYNTKGELSSSSTIAAASTVVGRARLYGYDNAGNRLRSRDGSGNSASIIYLTTNALNQYTSIPNTKKDSIGIFTPGNTGTVSIADQDYATTSNLTRYNNYGAYQFNTALPTGNDNTLGHARWFSINSTLIGNFYPGDPQKPRHDADGNMTWDGALEVDGTLDLGVSLEYFYDVENRLTAVENRDNRVEFTYDYMGRRVRQVTFARTGAGTVDHVLTTTQDLRFMYDGWHMIAQIKAVTTTSGTTFTPQKVYVWGLDISGTCGGAGGIGGLLAWYDRTAGQMYAPCYDGRGNVQAIYGMNVGHVISEYEYDQYGKNIRTTGYVKDATTAVWGMVAYDPISNPFRYQTKWRLQDSTGINNSTGYSQFDLYDYGKRWYNPKHGRFINRDPIGEQGGLNLYAFVGNDPVNQSDVLGMLTSDENESFRDTATYNAWRPKPSHYDNSHYDTYDDFKFERNAHLNDAEIQKLVLAQINASANAVFNALAQHNNAGMAAGVIQRMNQQAYTALASLDADTGERMGIYYKSLGTMAEAGIGSLERGLEERYKNSNSASFGTNNGSLSQTYSDGSASVSGGGSLSGATYYTGSNTATTLESVTRQLRPGDVVIYSGNNYIQRFIGALTPGGNAGHAGIVLPGGGILTARLGDGVTIDKSLVVNNGSITVMRSDQQLNIKAIVVFGIMAMGNNVPNNLTNVIGGGGYDVSALFGLQNRSGTQYTCASLVYSALQAGGANLPSDRVTTPNNLLHLPGFTQVLTWP